MAKLKQQVDRDISKTATKMAKADTYINDIVSQQKKIIDVAAARIKKVNSDLKAIRFRLGPYKDRKQALNAEYYRLKDEYEEALQERHVLENTIKIAEESIGEADLNTIGGQKYRPGEQM